MRHCASRLGSTDRSIRRTSPAAGGGGRRAAVIIARSQPFMDDDQSVAVRPASRKPEQPLAVIPAAQLLAQHPHRRAAIHGPKGCQVRGGDAEARAPRCRHSSGGTIRTASSSRPFMRGKLICRASPSFSSDRRRSSIIRRSSAETGRTPRSRKRSLHAAGAADREISHASCPSRRPHGSTIDLAKPPSTSL